METGEYDEALLRLHHFGPEFDGNLSNHGPMVVESMWRQGSAAAIHRWTDGYLERLDPAPRAVTPIGDGWREALGETARAGDWIEHFCREVAEHPWSEVVAIWWPRLLPGIAAGATHGVIRLGHALRSVRDVETAPRVDEVAHALAYWATRWQPVPLIRATGDRDVGTALELVPAISDQTGGIRHRLAQLDGTAGYAEQVGALGPPTNVATALERLVDAAVIAYGRYAPGNPTMLVHAATAPNAVRMSLPSLPEEVAPISFDAAWSATAAVMAAYRPSSPLGARTGLSPDTTFEAALDHGSEHVLKFADTALESFRRTGDHRALAAAATAIRLDA